MGRTGIRIRTGEGKWIMAGEGLRSRDVELLEARKDPVCPLAIEVLVHRKMERLLQPRSGVSSVVGRGGERTAA